ncbi:hypothetical protein FGG08_004771 [Glutinoglossum americanum]|uniref:BHLH domain-containing protein n=1 Tax=Glutinoglossum americanum TaxID=1670608 RepID=A0A9P8L3K3_9PEZI|nr:hypothetical protein FGG08_004771 [Glutinoglossum americanum]
MPPPALPPTPISSSDITAKDGLNLSSLELSFTLPPPAIARDDGSRSSCASNSSSSSFRPMSPKSPLNTTAEHAMSRRRPLAAVAAVKEDFALPPPPTRSRTIIQMKPRPDETPVQQQVNLPTKGTQNKAAASQNTGSNKRKQPTPTSVAGRKIARKTAHSLIERRRRSKMNEEFGVLKQMIPACQNQDMHKLAILQASIDYLRYLEQCIADLKANNTSNSPRSSPPSIRVCFSPQTHQSTQPDNERDDDPDVELDVDMADTFTPSSDDIASPLPQQELHQQLQERLTTHSATATPLISPQQQQQQQQQQHHYVLPAASLSTTTPPALQPHSPSTSPTILPQRDVDQEAAGALLLLDKSRRGSSGRGMSVKDLLSS